MNEAEYKPEDGDGNAGKHKAKDWIGIEGVNELGDHKPSGAENGNPK